MNDVNAPVDGELYAARQKIYPREIGGRFQKLRVYAVFALLGLYYVLPWIRWGERQAVLFDLPGVHRPRHKMNVRMMQQVQSARLRRAIEAYIEFLDRAIFAVMQGGKMRVLAQAFGK